MGYSPMPYRVRLLTRSSDLEQVTDDFPEDFFKMKVLPEMLKSVEFGGGGPKAFNIVMKIAGQLSNDDFETRIQPVVIRLFANPDRAIRVSLLDSLPTMIDRLPQKVVNDKIFPQMVTGFTDSAPVVREQTLKAVLVVVTKLSDRTINGELLRYLAKTANDEQPGIRTNTTICLGKLAKNLGTSSRSKVLIAAFTRSLRDPFVHGRNAALMSLGATSEYFSEEDMALKIMPAVCPLLVDKEKLVRDQASKTLDIYVQRVRKAAASMPDTALPATTTGQPGGPRMSTPQPSDGSSWTGWAISSFTNKMSSAEGDMQTTNGAGTGTGTGTSTPRITPSPGPSVRKPTSSASNLHRQAVTSPTPSTIVSPTPSVSADTYFEEAAGDEGDAWGDMGDMGDDDGFFDAPAQPDAGTAAKSATSRAMSSASVASPTPFDDGAEPDFAGWLAAQQQKKSVSGRPLPKGLSKSSGATATRKNISTKPAAKPLAAKKIDMKPKEADDDDDGWGDGW